MVVLKMENTQNKLNGNKLSNETVLTICILFIGILLRFGLAIVLPYDISGHDLGFWPTNDNPDCMGHLGYTAYIYYTGHLPDFDPYLKYSIYNPPVHYWINAHFMFILRAVGVSLAGQLESLQLLTALYSSLTLVFSYLIFGRLSENKKTICYATLAVAIQPSFTFGAAQVGNDTLALLFAILTIYFIVLWHQTDKICYLIITAFTLGLGMMTKLNVVLMAPAIAYFMLLHLIKRIKSKKGIVKTIFSYLAFGAISVPLGTWWSIKNYILFDLPLGYIDEPSKTSLQHITDQSFINRFIPNIANLTYPFVDGDTTTPRGDQSIFLTVLKHALFDNSYVENLTEPVRIVFLIAMYIAIVITVIAIVFSIKNTVKAAKNKDEIIIFAWIGIITYVASLIVFCFRFPYVCTQDFRYIAPAFVLFIMTLRKQKTAAN